MLGVIEFVRSIREVNPNVPIILLAYDDRELKEIGDLTVFSKVFFWQGDFRILLAIVKYVEDRENIEHDTSVMGVQTIIIVEDNIKFYSSYLPLIYSELVRHSQNLIAEGLNFAHKILRLRARPKIILCGSYEEACFFFDRYEDC